jgi:hypothetical protein
MTKKQSNHRLSHKRENHETSVTNDTSNSVSRILAVALFLFTVTVSIFHIWVLSHRPLGRTAPDPITVIDQRFEPLRKILPRHGRVGYLSNVVGEDFSVGSIYSARYALAPLVLVEGSDTPLVIANFHFRDNDSEKLHLKGYSLIRNFGNGLFLFKKED